MLLTRLLPTSVRLLAVGIIVLAAVSLARAGHHNKPGRCCPSPEVFYSDFFGYYRTCWRPWPGGQPFCPVYGTVTVEAVEMPAPGRAAPEKLPSPKPEAAPVK